MTILGRTAFRPGREQLRLLQRTEVTSGTGIQFFFNDAEHDMLLARFYDIEKQNNPSTTAVLRVSTNAASFESVGSYHFAIAGMSSATVWAARSATSGGSIEMMVALGVATATTAWGGSEVQAWIQFPSATTRVNVEFQHWFSNSASTPGLCHGYGNFASGPIRGLEFSYSGVGFTGKAELYGLKFSAV